MKDVKDMKAKLFMLEQQTERLRKDNRNAKLREKRSKKTCQSLLADLANKNLINTELELQLEAYKGMIIK